MSSNVLVEACPSHAMLSFNMPNIDDLFPGFLNGDFALVYGSSAVLPLSLLLTVRAQLPFQLGGVESNVVFVDGGNSFRLYRVSRIAQMHRLDPRQVLKRIFISRAFTAYQMTAIVLEKLEEAVQKFGARFVIISDIAGLYMDEDMPTNEAKAIFNHVTTNLSRFAEKNQLILMATCLPTYSTRLNAYFHSILFAKVNTVLAIRPSWHRHGQVFVLEKHPMFSLGYAEFPSENLTLTHFVEEGQA